MSSRYASVLHSRANLDAVQLTSFAGGTAALFTHAMPGGGRENQDAVALLAIDAKRGLLAVADGAGGHAAGAEAAAAALRTLGGVVTESRDVESVLRSVVLDGIERANEHISALSGGAATTLAVVEIDGRVIRPYHVGDSEILVTGQRGRVRLQIVPHSPTGYAVESGLLDAETAIGHVDRHFVSNVVGSAEMRIEVGPPLRLQSRDTVLLASDGLFDNLHQEEVVEIIRKGPLDRAAVELARNTLGRMQSQELHAKPDDLSFLLWRPWSGPVAGTAYLEVSL